MLLGLSSEPAVHLQPKFIFRCNPSHKVEEDSDDEEDLLPQLQQSEPEDGNAEPSRNMSGPGFYW